MLFNEAASLLLGPAIGGVCASAISTAALAYRYITGGRGLFKSDMPRKPVGRPDAQATVAAGSRVPGAPNAGSWIFGHSILHALSVWGQLGWQRAEDAKAFCKTIPQ